MNEGTGRFNVETFLLYSLSKLWIEILQTLYRGLNFLPGKELRVQV